MPKMQVKDRDSKYIQQKNACLVWKMWYWRSIRIFKKCWWGISWISLKVWQRINHWKGTLRRSKRWRNHQGRKSATYATRRLRLWTVRFMLRTGARTASSSMSEWVFPQLFFVILCPGGRYLSAICYRNSEKLPLFPFTVKCFFPPPPRASAIHRPACR